MSITNPTLALGMSGISDFGPNFPFIDQVKRSRNWVDADFAPITEDVFDANGWPLTMPSGGNLKKFWTYLGQSGNYVMTWEGDATFTLSGATGSITTVGRRKTFSYDIAAPFSINITALGGTPISNIKVMRADQEALYNLGETFNPDWLDVVKDSRQLRFMDAMRTNDSTMSEWADRSTPGYHTWNIGMPVEPLVELANKIGVDPWFCMPHLATEEYFTEFATYVRDNLNPELVAYVEYSNECWNFDFDQAHWLDDEAKAAWGDTAAYLDYQAKRNVEMAQAWLAVYAGEEDRLHLAFGAQTGSVGNITRAVTGSRWATFDPANFVAPYTLFNSLCVTSYFGINSTQRAELLTYRSTHTDDETYTWFAGKFLDPSYATSISAITGLWTATNGVASTYGLGLVLYEGGQHVHYAYVGQTEDERAFFEGFCRSEQIVTVYDALWDAWYSFPGDGPFMQFVEISRSSNSGTWGMLRSPDDTTPRATFMLDRNAEQDSWFGDGGGSRYIPETIKALTDGQSCDVDVRGGVVTGTTGKERVNVAGAAADYTLTNNGDGTFTLTKSGFELTLSGVDGIRCSA